MNARQVAIEVNNLARRCQARQHIDADGLARLRTRAYELRGIRNDAESESDSDSVDSDSVVVVAENKVR